MLKKIFLILITIFLIFFSVLFLKNKNIKNSFLLKIKAASTSTSSVCKNYGYEDLDFSQISDDIKEDLIDYCKKLYKDNLYVYGGGWGRNAKCYSHTKLCATSPLCVNSECLRCLYETTNINNCISAGLAPSNVVNRQKQCPESGDMVYLWGPANECYLKNGGVAYTKGGEPYCVNSKLPNIENCCKSNFKINLCCRLNSTTPLDPRCFSASSTIPPGLPTPTKNPLCKEYDCKSIGISNSISNRKFYLMFKNGKKHYYSDSSCTKDVTDYGVGNWCKGKIN
ncbi:MAG: hypothetical protein NC935_08240 [Candidatus Omnitrophica bacterium]|nr:hypothetical protein [Candidatus Omnitrophota bacterium]